MPTPMQSPPPAQMSSAPIPAAFAAEAIECGRLAGVDMGALIQDLGIPEQDLQHLTPDQFGQIWLELSFRMRDEFFGLAARPMRPGSFTLLGHATRHAPTLEVAVARALRFLTVVLEDPAGTLSVEGRHAEVTLREEGAPKSAFAYRLYFTILHALNCWLIGERIPIQRIQFPCAAPEGTNDYGDFFGVPVVFSAPVARLEFERKYLRKPINRSDRALKVFLKSAPTAFLSGYRHGDGIKARVVAELSLGEVGGWPGVDEIAQRLGLSTSTLHRRLKEAGQSFGEIKEERRRNLALSLLKKTDLPVAEIAGRVGYAEPSAFFRAFQRWFGTTPGAIRNRG
ncbi:putative HTH-type transcriptional regulator [Aliiroseovarius sp. xm-m-379]|uniref:AraC family transcriptional regulator n=3 Tax=unclassified Aliiroseovarius TaxID=2623558 RepID=UPI0019FF9568|nr:MULTISPECIES: AraC family transcriptional regulator [unclassified Aliiroseovarius]NRP25006.1 putative HTH-type transcriptional regulator [Aliiroseovarius sp. xm-m-379]NRP31473.1 putative HTH-type transcriptional regulator [Aliiroseovarius sp. xm-m-314]NRP33805.1 putative HTH-type transcriptional regulator [Aliiroseovarius sp. xm-a-104]NRP45293.1 putative HTH-type transcriptional regulator [Aliiroseovarius sp. xm-m-378]NRP50484.1 putative HTH-type transcriptional regulator [Aliiroseovarius s